MFQKQHGVPGMALARPNKRSSAGNDINASERVLVHHKEAGQGVRGAGHGARGRQGIPWACSAPGQLRAWGSLGSGIAKKENKTGSGIAWKHLRHTGKSPGGSCPRRTGGRQLVHGPHPRLPLLYRIAQLYSTVSNSQNGTRTEHYSGARTENC